LAAPPTTIGILLFDEPEAGAHRCHEAFRSTKPQMSGQQPVDDLAGVEDDGLAARLAVMSRKGAIRVLEESSQSIMRFARPMRSERLRAHTRLNRDYPGHPNASILGTGYNLLSGAGPMSSRAGEVPARGQPRN
jgi:hypothetical protein